MYRHSGYSNIGLYQASYNPQSAERHTVSGMDDFVEDVRGSIDSTPIGVAAIGLMALGVLVLLNRTGFRFSFGVSAGK